MAACLIGLSVILAPRLASADQFVVTGGAFEFAWEAGAGVNVSGPAFFVHNTDSNPEEFGVPGLGIEHADPFASTLPLGGHIVADASGGLTLTDGSGDFNGELVFDLTFNAGRAKAHTAILPADPFDPSCTGTCREISATGPFRLSGRLTAFPGGTAWQRMLTGHGLATVGFREKWGELRPFASYRFEADAPAPTPEPASMLLTGTGIMALVSRVRRRRGVARSV